MKMYLNREVQHNVSQSSRYQEDVFQSKAKLFQAKLVVHSVSMMRSPSPSTVAEAKEAQQQSTRMCGHAPVCSCTLLFFQQLQALTELSV